MVDTFTISKRFRFSAAHALPQYSGECGSIHGHNFVAWINVSGTQPLQDKKHSADSTGEMFIECSMIKAIGERVLNGWDHGLISHLNTQELVDIFSQEHNQSLLYLFCIRPEQVIALGAAPTMENMAKHIGKCFWTLFQARHSTVAAYVSKVEVVLQETENNICTFELKTPNYPG